MTFSKARWVATLFLCSDAKLCYRWYVCGQGGKGRQKWAKANVLTGMF